MRWPLIPLGNLITLQRGYDLPESARRDGEVPIVTSSGITGYHEVAAEKGPGVVTGRYGTIGEVHYVEGDYWPHNTTLFVKDFKGNDPRFVRYLLTSLNLSNQVSSGAVPGVNRNVLHTLLVPDVQHGCQMRVADVLSAYDDLIENNRRRVVLLEEAARQLYREWFVRLRFPGHEHTPIRDGVLEGWEKRRIGDIADCVGGGTPSTSVSAYWDAGDITWVTPTDVTRNQHFVLLDSEKKITEAGLQNSSARMVPPHAVLMTSRASVGYFAVASREVCTNQGFISVVPYRKLYTPYLLFHLSERVAEIRSMGSGATYPEVSRGKFREFEVLVPETNVLPMFGEDVEVILNQIRLLKFQNQKLRAARELLLPRLMSGEITP